MATDLLGEYLTPAALASELGICTRTLERWHRLGEAPPRTTVGRRIMYRRDSVAAWLRAREHDSAEAA